MDDPYPAVAALAAGAASCFFSLAESALNNYSPHRLLDIAKRKKREEAIQPFIDTDEQILLSCRALAIIAQAVFVLATYFWWTEGLPSIDAWERVKAGALACAVLLTFGRMIPLFVGRIFAEGLVFHLRPVLEAVHLVASPLTAVLRGIRVLTARVVGRPSEQDSHEQIQEDILSAVEEGEMEGLLREEEADLIERALDFHDADVADVMTPRTRMFSLNVDAALSEAVRQVSDAGHSRIPVHKRDVDEIVGVLYAKDVLKHWGAPDSDTLTIGGIVRKPFFVPETKKISQLLDEFKHTKRHIAIVLDEYGGTAGLITIEDILEEIVGEIEDEYDESLDKPLLAMNGDSEAEVDAQVHVDELGDALDVEIASDDFDTVGGMVFSVLGRIPAVGDEFDYAGLHVTVLDANDRAVNRVKVVRTAP